MVSKIKRHHMFCSKYLKYSQYYFKEFQFTHFPMLLAGFWIVQGLSEYTRLFWQAHNCNYYSHEGNSISRWLETMGVWRLLLDSRIWQLSNPKRIQRSQHITWNFSTKLDGCTWRQGSLTPSPLLLQETRKKPPCRTTLLCYWRQLDLY